MTDFCPSSAKYMILSSGCLGLVFFLLSCSKMSMSAANISSWRHLFLPWVRTVLHPARSCTTVLHTVHKSVFPHSPPKLMWVWGVSCIALSRNKIRKGSSQFSPCNFPPKFTLCPGAFCSKLSGISSSALFLEVLDFMLDQESLYLRGGL